MIDALLLSCSIGVSPSTMKEIIRVESGGNPHAIFDGFDSKSYYPKTKEKAVALAKELIKKGHRLDVGYAGINITNLKYLGVSIDEVFEPCTNIKSGAKILRDFYVRALKKGYKGNDALIASISAYNTGSFRRGVSNGYVAKVMGIKNKTYKVSLVTKTIEKKPFVLKRVLKPTIRLSVSNNRTVTKKRNIATNVIKRKNGKDELKLTLNKKIEIFDETDLERASEKANKYFVGNYGVNF